jgi:hypothetical protein
MSFTKHYSTDLNVNGNATMNGNLFAHGSIVASGEISANALVIQSELKPVITIKSDGNVEFSEGLNLSAASRKFWEVVNVPGSGRDKSQYVHRLEDAILSVAGLLGGALRELPEWEQLISAAEEISRRYFEG